MKTGFKEQPHWFTGVVEDINDPSEMGRLKVRCFGYHTPNKKDMPTKNLPWSHVMMPIHNASMSGIGQSATGVLQGSWVIGFFRDGEALQDPFVIGTLPSMATSLPAITNGFADPDGNYPRSDRLHESDLTPACRDGYSEAQPYISKNDLRQEDVETAVPPRVSSVQPDKEDAYYKRNTWKNHELDDIIAPEYPKNHVYESESGHILEVDDTPTKERLSRFHKSGTYEEIVSNGDRTLTIVGDGYEVVIKNKNVLIKGDLNLTVNGNMRTLVKKDYILEVEGDKTEYVKGNRKSKTGLHELIEIGAEPKEDGTGGVPADRLVNVSGNFTTRVGGNEIRDIAKDRTLNTTGHYSSTVAGNSTTVTNGDATETVLGTFTISSEGNLTLTSTSTTKIDTQSDIDIDAKNNIVITTPANVDVDGARIDLN